MSSRVRVNWKVLLPFTCFIAIVLYMGTISLISKPKTVLPHSFRDLHHLEGDGEPKKRRRPDLHEHRSVIQELKTVHKEQTSSGEPHSTPSANRKKSRLHVAIVACGDRVHETIVSLKAFTMFSKELLHFHIFTEDHLQSQFLAAISKWPSVSSSQLIFDVQKIQFPVVENPHIWKTMFKPCACQRLFLPIILKDVDALLYVDTDVLTLTPLENIWSLFSKFNSTQLSGLAAESEVEATGWYNRFGRHPYYGKLGLNSGVMLMNLTRMREVDMVNLFIPLYEKYKSDILWGDQDILNILFHFHPEMVYLFPCNWNYRTDHCMYGSSCEAADKDGIFLVHGSRGVFHTQRQPEFKVLFDAFESYDLDRDTPTMLRKRIDDNLEKYKSTYCGALRKEFTQAIVS